MSFLKRGIGVLLTLAVAAVPLSIATPASAAPVADPERTSAEQVGWGFFFNETPQKINDWAVQNNARVINVAADSPTGFTVQLVVNSGGYDRDVAAASSWTFDQTQSGLTAKLAAENKRPLSIHRYKVNGQDRFAAALVENDSTNYHPYQLLFDKTPAEIGAALDAFGGRITDLAVSSPGRYDVVAQLNSGADGLAWGWYFGKTPAAIKTLINDTGGRVLDLEPDGPGTFTVVLVPNNGTHWWYHTAGSRADLDARQAQTGARIAMTKAYKDAAGQTRYVALYVDDQDPVSAGIRDTMAAELHDRPFGFFLKEVDGPVRNSINAERVFDPASAAKVLLHITTMRKVHAGLDHTGNTMTFFRSPQAPNNVNICAYTDDGVKQTSLPVTDSVFGVSRRMMEQSDNRATDAFFDRHGLTAINKTADDLGMTKTEYRVRLGCAPKAPGQTGTVNDFTLTDLGRLYESVYRASAPELGTGADRDNFAKAMNDIGELLYGPSPLSDVIDAETGGNTAFRNAVTAVHKGGGASIQACDACTEATVRRSSVGMISLPFKDAAGTITPRKYVYGVFTDGVFDCGGTNCAGPYTVATETVAQAVGELLRPQIRAAAQTW